MSKATASGRISLLPPLWRERMISHRLERAAKRRVKQANYHSNGLNGPRAVARRQRQIAKGRLRP